MGRDALGLVDVADSGRIESDGVPPTRGDTCMLRYMSGSLAAGVAAIGLVFFTASPAFANIITITGGLGTVDCTQGCEAFTGAGSPGEPTGLGILSNSAADTYPGSPSSEAAETTRLNTLAGTSFLSTDTTNIDTGGVGSFMISTLAEYFLLKIGNVAIYLMNTSGGLLDVSYVSTPGAGSGLSHYAEFGEVPLPAAGWLMLAGLAGLSFSARRKMTA